MNAAAAALVVLNGRQAFDPRASLFAHNEPGFWYDPSDLSSMYQDSAGTTPVTAVEQAVGLVLDKSKGLVIGTNIVTNPGPFTATTDWTGQNSATLSVASAKLRVSGNGVTAFPFASTPFTTIVGRGYFVSTDVAFVSGVNDSVYIQKSDAAASVVNGVTSGTAPATSKTLFFVATATTTYLQLVSDDATDVYDWDNISVRELAGNHAIQPGATNRPILRSRYNLGTYSEDLTNAAWQKLASGTGVVPVVTNNYATAPDGTNTATRVQFDLGATPATAVSRLFQNNNDSRTALRTRRYWFKTADGTTKTIYTTGQDAADVLRTITGTWQQFVLSDTSAQVAAYAQHQFGLNGNTSTSVDLLVWHPELVYSTDAYLPYQRVNAATDYDTVGFPVYLAFDGSDDSLYTGGNVDFSATDKVTLWAGVTKLSDAAAAPIIELGPDSGANNGVFAIFAPSGGGVADYYWRSKGTAASNNSVTGNASPSTRVLTAIGDIAADFANLRVDGVDNTKSDDQGTGNFASAVVNIGRRNNATAPFNGRVYALLGRGAATSAALLSQAERWVAGKQGRAL